MINAPAAPADQRETDEIELRQLMHAIWRRKWLVVVASIAGAALGLGLAYLNTRYASEALLLMPKGSLGAYRRYEVALVSEPRLVQFLQEGEQSATPAGRLLLASMRRPGAMAEMVQPVFTHTDRDTKLLGIKIENPSGFLGVRLRVEHAEAMDPPPVRLLAEYMRDTVIKIDLEERILTACLEQQTSELELRNTQLEDDFRAQQQRERVTSLKEILERTPGAAQIDTRQVVSLDSASERFLSPVAQMVAAEVSIAELELAKRKRERELVAATLKRDYYCLARDALAKPTTGRAFLAGLKGLQSTVLEGHAVTEPVVEMTANAFTVERERWQNDYLSQMRFVTAPEGMQTLVRRPGRAVGLALGATLGMMLGVLLALWLAWWKENREVIVAEDD